jgi:DNA-binding response OmpR family regulator
MKKILYIEDDEDTAVAVAAILTNAGFKTEIAFSGERGIEKAKDGFDLIMIDIMLPGMSGWDVFTKLKDKVDSKFVFLSAIPVSRDRKQELKRTGISEYITKPFIKQDLLNRINKVLN